MTSRDREGRLSDPRRAGAGGTRNQAAAIVNAVVIHAYLEYNRRTPAAAETPETSCGTVSLGRQLKKYKNEIKEKRDELRKIV